MPTMPILPVDLFSRGTDMALDTFKHTRPDFYIHNYPEILDLKVNAKTGVYDVVAMTNWHSARRRLASFHLPINSDSTLVLTGLSSTSGTKNCWGRSRIG